MGKEGEIEKEGKIEKESPIETPEDFQNWVIKKAEKAEKSDDYVEFYYEAQNKYLDLSLKDKRY